MLDENIVVEKQESVEYTPIPEDVYTVELYDVNAKVEETYDSKQERKADPTLPIDTERIFDFQFVLLEGRDGNKDLRGRCLFQNFVPSYLYISTKKGKNKLYQIVEALQGQTLSPQQEAEGITGKYLNGLIGKHCRVGTTNKTTGDKTYSNIDKFLVVKEHFAPLTQEEKENAKVKPKNEDTSTAVNDKSIDPNEPPMVDENGIPF